MLKHHLCATSVKLKQQKKRYNQKLINRTFSVNPKAVYCDFKINNITKEKLLKKESIETFWEGIWKKKQLLTSMKTDHNNWKLTTAAM